MEHVSKFPGFRMDFVVHNNGPGTNPKGEVSIKGGS
jgi:hypothetical protein